MLIFEREENWSTQREKTLEAQQRSTITTQLT